MLDLYWLTTLGSLGETLAAIAVIGGIILLCFNIAYIIKEFQETTTKFFKTSWILWCVVTLLAIIIPSKNQLYFIYGVGSTIDYLKENPTAQQLPDKCIKVLDKWAEEELNKKE